MANSASLTKFQKISLHTYGKDQLNLHGLRLQPWDKPRLPSPTENRRLPFSFL